MLADGSTGEVVQGLFVGYVQVAAKGFGFAQDDTGPEQINPAGPSGGCSNSVTLEEVDTLRDDPEAAEQIGPELLGC